MSDYVIIEDVNELRDLLKLAKSKAATDWEKTFIREQIERFKRFGHDLHLSQKQLDMIKKIAQREVFDDDL